MQLSDRAWTLSRREELGVSKYLPNWQWGEETLDQLHEAIRRARNALHRVDDINTLQQHLSDWPWEYVEMSSLAEALTRQAPRRGKRVQKDKR